MKNKYEIVGKEIRITLKRRNSTMIGIVGIEYLEKLKSFDITWFPKISPNSKLYYVAGSKYLGIKNGKPRYKTIYLHRYILDAEKNTYIDHVDHDPMNNLSSNLRVATNGENTRHRKSKNSNNKSGYRNISLDQYGYYIVQLQINGKNKNFGRFKDLNLAISCVEKERLTHYKKFSGESQ